jgi:hypothetical protein
MHYNPEVWGPHYWFFLHTIANTYPDIPNNVTKRKYYDLIVNMPIFIPHDKIGNMFAELLDKYPVSPYLDNRDSFVRWVYFIHNKINHHLGKEEITYLDALERYKQHFQPKSVSLSERLNIKKHYIYVGITFILILLIYVFYK